MNSNTRDSILWWMHHTELLSWFNLAVSIQGSEIDIAVIIFVKFRVLAGSFYYHFKPTISAGDWLNAFGKNSWLERETHFNCCTEIINRCVINSLNDIVLLKKPEQVRRSE